MDRGGEEATEEAEKGSTKEGHSPTGGDRRSKMSRGAKISCFFFFVVHVLL